MRKLFSKYPVTTLLLIWAGLVLAMWLLPSDASHRPIAFSISLAATKGIASTMTRELSLRAEITANFPHLPGP